MARGWKMGELDFVGVCKRWVQSHSMQLLEEDHGCPFFSVATARHHSAPSAHPCSPATYLFVVEVPRECYWMEVLKSVLHAPNQCLINCNIANMWNDSAIICLRLKRRNGFCWSLPVTKVSTKYGKNIFRRSNIFVAVYFYPSRTWQMFCYKTKKH